MGALRRFWESSVGKKIVMAGTGLIMVGFLIVHVAGNLLVFEGAEKINGYSRFLHAAGELLWPARAVLLVSVFLHSLAAWQLTQRAHAARPDDYILRDPQVTTLAARTMRWGSVFLAAFIVLHILHFTTGTIHPAFSAGGVYGNVVIALRVWWVAALYLLAMVVVGLHLYHGTWSAFRTIGVAKPSREPLRHRLALVLAVGIAGLFALVPVAIVLGLVR